MNRLIFIKFTVSSAYTYDIFKKSVGSSQPQRFTIKTFSDIAHVPMGEQSF